MKNSSASFLMLSLCVATASAVAPSHAAADPTPREDMQDAYRRQLRNNSIFLRGAPLHHIVPVKDTATYSLALDSYDVTIGPDKDHWGGGSGTIDNHYLKLTGYTISPLVSVQAKNFGLGFQAEKGYRRSLYRENLVESRTYQETQSRLEYSGVGVYAYATPTIGALPKSLFATFIVGTKLLNAEHKTAQPKFSISEIDTNEFTKYRYSVQKTSVGANLTMRLAHRVSIIPWYDYTWVKTGAVKTGSGDDTDVNADNLSAQAQTVLADQDLFWRSEPNQRFGIDVVAVLGKFEVNFGGLLGLIGGMNLGSDRIVDHTVTVNLSFSTKTQ